MRVIIQRVSQASVKVDGKLISEIGQGILILVGITHSDDINDVAYLTNKIVHLRIFNDSHHRMNLSLQDINGEILCVSQFTLYADTKKGNRPSYIEAANTEMAIKIYESFCDSLSDKIGRKIQQGIFGANMQVELLNDGPVTIILDSNTTK